MRLLLKRGVQVAAAFSLTAGLLIAPTPDAPVAEASGYQFSPCNKINRGEVKYSTHDAKRVTFATAARRGESRVLITSCVRKSNGDYKEEWQTWGYGGLNGFAPKGKMWENTWYSPTGSFSVTEALGRYDPGTRLKYHKIQRNSKWGGERGRTYNQYFEGRGGPSDENLWRYMNQGYYEQAAVINYNRQPDMKTIQGASFAIFFHAGNTTSAGCISTHLSTVKRYLRTARKGDRFIMGTKNDVFRSGRNEVCKTGDRKARELRDNLRNASIRSKRDLVAVDWRGRQWTYPGNGKGDLKKRFRASQGNWKDTTYTAVTDWNNDGILDILAKWEDGRLTVHKGSLNGGFPNWMTVGKSGWQNMRVSVGKFCDSFSRPQIVTVDKRNGNVYFYGNQGDHLANRVKIDRVSRSAQPTMLDHNRDGNQDILMTKPRGRATLLQTDGEGHVLNQGHTLNEKHRTFAHGFNRAYSISVVEGFDGRNSLGLVANFPDKTLRYFDTTKRWILSPDTLWGDKSRGYRFGA